MLITAVTNRLREADAIWGDRVYPFVDPLDEREIAAREMPYLIVTPRDERVTQPNTDGSQIYNYVIRRTFDVLAVMNRPHATDQAGQVAADALEVVRDDLLVAFLDWRPSDCTTPPLYETMRLEHGAGPVLIGVFGFSVYEELNMDRVREALFEECASLSEIRVILRGKGFVICPGQQMEDDCE